MSSSSPSGKELASTFNPADIESSLYSKWLKADYFTADASSSKEAFTIVLPPPNVTGVLHIGHALDQTLQDCLSRMKRMKGYEVLWLPGMDHAGIATQNVCCIELNKFLVWVLASTLRWNRCDCAFKNFKERLLNTFA